MAYTFNGTNQTLRVESGIVSAYPFTMAASVNVTTGSSIALFVAVNPGISANDPYIYLGHRENRVLTAGIVTTDSGTSINSAQNVITFGSQFWVAATYTSSAVTLFYNGSNLGSVSHAIAFPSGLSRFSIGTLERQSSFGYLAGSIAETAIWNVELTAAEIASLAAGFTPDQIRPQSLQFYAPLIRNLADLRLGRTITNVNGATVSTHPRIIQ